VARILIADDSLELLQCIRKIIEERPDWKICGEASDGLQAVSRAAQLTPDLVILDLTMPNLNGFQAARAIRSAAPRIPLLLYTQHLFDTHLEREAREAGFSGAVAKDSSAALAAAIKSLLRGETYFAHEVASPSVAVADTPVPIVAPKKPEGTPDETV
jgi:DNA-binding NarL/FixJ family response regulator